MQITNSHIPHVGPGTPAGDWLRRYWHAVGTEKELYDIPQAVRVLGENLVLFRDLNGIAGLLGQNCAHRGASLEYGDIEARGIRCPYHGWLYDVNGRCLEQPSEPKGNEFCHKVRQVSYPVHEQGGLIFAYLGPNPDEPPPFLNYSALVDHGGQRLVEDTRHFDYNWFNFYENSADPAHVWILHGASGYGQQTWGERFFSVDDPPAFEPMETPYGMKIVMTKPGNEPGTEFVDEMSLGMPNILQVGDTPYVHAKVDPQLGVNTGSDYEHCLFLTPNDDDHFMLFTVDYYTGPEPHMFEKLARMRQRERPTQKVESYDKRPLMPFRGNVRREDIVAQGTQDLVGHRAEHLGPSDRGVIMLRKLVRQAIEDVAEGKAPKGLHLDESAAGCVTLDSFVGVRSAGQE